MAVSDYTQYVLKNQAGQALAVKTVASIVETTAGSNVQAELDAIRQTLSGQTQCYIVANITARDAISSPNVGDLCWVKDASADSTVTSGAAEYIYEDSTNGWVKIAEAESMDVVVSWADIQNKPSSTVAAIDAAATFVAGLDSAVTAAALKSAIDDDHTHSNKSVLDAIDSTAKSGYDTASAYVAALTKTASEVNSGIDEANKVDVAFIAAGGTIPSNLKTGGLVLEAVATA